MEKVTVVYKDAKKENTIEAFEKKTDATKFINKLKKSEEKLMPNEKEINFYSRNQITEKEYDEINARSEEE